MNFKIGDEVIITRPTFSFDEVGDTMIVTRVTGKLIYALRPKSERPDYGWSYLHTRIRKVTKLDRALK